MAPPITTVTAKPTSLPGFKDDITDASQLRTIKATPAVFELFDFEGGVDKSDVIIDHRFTKKCNTLFAEETLRYVLQLARPDAAESADAVSLPDLFDKASALQFWFDITVYGKDVVQAIRHQADKGNPTVLYGDVGCVYSARVTPATQPAR